MSIISKIVLKRLLEFKVFRSGPGRMNLKSRAPENIYNQLEPYDEYLKRAIFLLDGIDEVELNYNTGTILILYDIEKTGETRILKWVNKITDIGMENQETIEAYANRDIGELEILLERQLMEEVKNL